MPELVAHVWVRGAFRATWVTCATWAMSIGTVASAWAQSAPPRPPARPPAAGAPGAAAGATAGIYTCLDAQGRRLSSDRPIADCAAVGQRLHNRDGSVKSVVPPVLSAEEVAAQEAKNQARMAQEIAHKDAVRRDRNLMQRYPNEAAHQRARRLALDDVRLAITASERRLEELRRERKPLMDEAEFYLGKALPVDLKRKIDANDAAIEAQYTLMRNQEAESGRIHQIFDGELARLRLLWAGAQPGSLPEHLPAAADRPQAGRSGRTGPAAQASGL